VSDLLFVYHLFITKYIRKSFGRIQSLAARK